MTLGHYKSNLARQVRGSPVSLLNGILIPLKSNVEETEEDNEFIWWVHQTRRLSSMMTQRDSNCATDVHYEHKLRYEHAKLKDKCKLRSRAMCYAPVSQHESAGATSVATSSRQGLDVSSSVPITNGGKRQRSQADPGSDVYNSQRLTGNLAAGVSQTSMNDTT